MIINNNSNSSYFIAKKEKRLQVFSTLMFVCVAGPTRRTHPPWECCCPAGWRKQRPRTPTASSVENLSDLRDTNTPEDWRGVARCSVFFLLLFIHHTDKQSPNAAFPSWYTWDTDRLDKQLTNKHCCDMFYLRWCVSGTVLSRSPLWGDKHKPDNRFTTEGKGTFWGRNRDHL